uniref:isopentenyl-diphosphate Delta-isomerase n=1 Tax=Zooxanthella nutricula TaxID=1333877 RepID=A0A7S2M2J8_9DINO
MAEPAKGVVWSPEGMSQDDFMLKDECIVVNYMDEVIGHDNKYNCHKFLPGQPRGILHRAFSVMLFDADGRLLLQQRAASKITFPNVWTNTCCSHPLHGMRPREVDTPEEIASGSPRGVKHAAVRKLGHELGIPARELEVDRFRFMTRVHYWAADVVTYGPNAPWGEHEIDHLLLYQLKPNETLTIKPDPEEVQAFKWMAQSDLKAAMSGVDAKAAAEMRLWSPWFKIIAERFLHTWWADLRTALEGQKYVDLSGIHRFDTSAEFHGGAGNARPHLDALAAQELAQREGGENKRRKLALDAQHDDGVAGFVGRGKAIMATNADGAKQGSYGKVPTHSSGKLDQLCRPLEVVAALRFKLGGLLEDNLKDSGDADVMFCDDMLGKVSRSFAAVIRQLPSGLCLDICVFYLVLRALDTVEDDMEAYKGKEHEKEEELKSFGAKRLTDKNCSITGVGAGDELALVESFGAVSRVFASLPEGSRDVIMDITNQMGAGMAEYVTADLCQGCVDQAAYDRYCHMVAGLVGEGLSRIFVARGAESDAICGQGERVWPFCPDPKTQPANMGLANSMGLFLQKCNIIRDYLEDYVDGRSWWPQTTWKKYAKTNDLGEFARPSAHGAGLCLPMKGPAAKVAGKGVGVQALQCLNELVADSLELVPDCLEYLNRMRTPSIYRFCAIPQVMAMATLAACFDNPRLFTGVVKIRKGLTARLIIGTIDGPDAVAWWFGRLAQDMLARLDSGACVSAEGALGDRLRAACARIERLTRAQAGECEAKRTQKGLAVCGTLTLAAAVAVALAQGRTLGAR